MKKYLWLVLLGFIWLIVSPNEVLACRCVSSSQRQFYKRANAVVVAQVKSVEIVDGKANLVKVELSVETTWKHSVSKQVIVYSSGESCDFNFEAGVKYLLYLTESEAGFTTSKCAGNKAIDSANESLRWLRRYAKQEVLP